MLSAALGVGVFAAYVRMTPSAGRVPDDLRRESTRAALAAEPPAPKVTRKPEVTIEAAPRLMVPEVQGEKVKLVRATNPLPDGDKPIVFVANETLKALKLDKARALGVHVKDGIAIIDFNSELNQGFGSSEESILIKALQMGLGQFKEVEKFQIRIDGEIVESLGHFEIVDPVDVIRPGQKTEEPETTTGEAQ